MNLFRNLIMSTALCFTQQTSNAQDTISVYIQNVDFQKNSGIASLYEVVNYPYLHLVNKSIPLEYRIPKKIKLISYKLTFNGGIYPVWEGDTINVVFNKQTGSTELSRENNNLFLFYEYLSDNFYKKYVSPNKFEEDKASSTSEFVNYTESYYQQKDKIIKTFFNGKKLPLLHLILKEEIECQKLDSYLSSKDRDSLINKDSILSLYKNIPTSLEKYGSNYYRLDINNLNYFFTQKDFPAFLSTDDFNQAFITTAQKYFSKEVTEFLLMLKLWNFKKNSNDVNMQSAEMTLNYLLHSTLDTQYKNMATQFYIDYKKALKTLSNLLTAKLKTYSGKVVELREVVNVGTPLFMDFWATWCGPCIAEFPSLDKVSRANRNIRFISLSIDEDEDKWRKFVKERKLDIKNTFLLVGAKENLLANTYSLTDVPRFIVFNAKGECVSSNFIRPSEQEFDVMLKKSLILKSEE
ncbi:TlpA family protein disulfide reductase [Parafilimonas sp.]|uniref:TlpA family protein disulfide reductase n=1 Tax=Parafilimonas sp. TaxID=1969739 RepID=UPI0039E315F2